ncbi:MAG: hypothetical protein IIC96_18175 [Chloroflexi bacterium]|nr:hypothetical protein [Chloroflexota bacterium]
MTDLKCWLGDQGLTVRELATQLEVPLKTVQDWVYRAGTPSPVNQEKLAELMKCTHHWVIDAANGHTSRGVCRLCNEVRAFDNSIDNTVWKPPNRNAAA